MPSRASKDKMSDLESQRGLRDRIESGVEARLPLCRTAS